MYNTEFPALSGWVSWKVFHRTALFIRIYHPSPTIRTIETFPKQAQKRRRHFPLQCMCMLPRATLTDAACDTVNMSATQEASRSAASSDGSFRSNSERACSPYSLSTSPANWLCASTKLFFIAFKIISLETVLAINIFIRLMSLGSFCANALFTCRTISASLSGVANAKLEIDSSCESESDARSAVTLVRNASIGSTICLVKNIMYVSQAIRTYWSSRFRLSRFDLITLGTGKTFCPWGEEKMLVSPENIRCTSPRMCARSRSLMDIECSKRSDSKGDICSRRIRRFLIANRCASASCKPTGPTRLARTIDSVHTCTTSVARPENVWLSKQRYIVARQNKVFCSGENHFCSPSELFAWDWDSSLT